MSRKKIKSQGRDDSDAIYVSVLIAAPLLFAVLLLLIIVGPWLISCRNNRPIVQRTLDDCVRGAPQDCVRSSIEESYDRNFHGYIYCACVTSSGMAKGFVAADSSIHLVGDTEARAQRTDSNNDNPAVNFPVGVPHR